MEGTVSMVMQDAIYTVLKVALPIMLVALVIGVIISIFQATTQINEQTLAFVPKIIGIFLALLVFGSWMLVQLKEFVFRMFEQIGTPPV